MKHKANLQLSSTAVVLTMLPVLLNLIALWHDVGLSTVQEVIRGTYRCYGGAVCNPLPEILVEIIGASALLGGVGTLVVLVGTSRYLRRLHAGLQYLAWLVLALPVGLVCGIASGYFMPLNWLTVFGDYKLGHPVSTFAVQGGLTVVFPLTALAILISSYLLSKSLALYEQGLTVSAAGAG